MFFFPPFFSPGDLYHFPYCIHWAYTCLQVLKKSNCGGLLVAILLQKYVFKINCLQLMFMSNFESPVSLQKVKMTELKNF